MDWEPSTQQQSRTPQAVVATPSAPPPVAPAPGVAPEATGPAASHDPWTRAVEQAPGVWVVGDTSNVGRNPTAEEQAEEAEAPLSTPRYEPAAAQIPPTIPVSGAGSGSEPDWGLAPVAPSPGGDPAGPTRHPAEGAAVPEELRVPEYAMASAAPEAAPTAATATRQSLYQRLSNSPEAEAGRAKAPARAVAAASTYVQDIPSADDETIEESGVFGRAAVERILGGKLIEERSLDGSPITPRY